MTTKANIHIINALREGFSFLRAQIGYVATAAIIPLFAHIAITLFLNAYRPDAQMVERFLWALPAHILTAWYLFLVARAMAYGETIKNVPRDIDGMRAFAKAMHVSIIVSILFNMLLLLIFLFQVKLDAALGGTMGEMTAAHLSGLENAEPREGDGMRGMIYFVMLIALFWVMRYVILAAAAAIGLHPVAFAQKLRGAMLSLQIVALIFLTYLPPIFIWILLRPLFIPEMPDGGLTGFSMFIAVLLDEMRDVATLTIAQTAYVAAVMQLGVQFKMLVRLDVKK